MSKKTVLISTIVAVTWLIGITWLILATLGNKNYIDREGTAVIWKKDADVITFEPNQTLDLRQYVTATQPDLARLILYVKTPSDIDLTCELLDPDSGTVIRTGQTITVRPGSVMPATWAFDPIADSTGGHYIAHITGRVGTEPFSIFTVQPNRFDGGTLIIDAQPVDNLRLVLDWEYYETNPLQTLFHRLTYAKPGLLGMTVIVYILAILFIIASALAVAAVLSIND